MLGVKAAAEPAPRGGLPHAQVVRRLEAALAARVPVRIHEPGYRRAAVAVLFVDRGGASRVPMIVRGAGAPTHSNQVAFPGGTSAPGEDDPVATAAREAEEELGVPPAATRLLGLLDDVPTPTGFVITPVVAELAPWAVLHPDPREVAGWFEAPLEIFFDRDAAESLGEREWKGARYHLRAYHHGDHRIWGATARIMEAVVDLLSP
ncbi:MAG TPA: CoA pyrophosphatase [Kofleriaceae bacterium]|nr:CoA pyrophosphatase [Kofleriaceae bacterium]